MQFAVVCRYGDALDVQVIDYFPTEREAKDYLAYNRPPAGAKFEVAKWE